MRRLPPSPTRTETLVPYTPLLSSGTPKWVLTYRYWATSHDSHIFEGTCYFVPPQNAYERLQQELAVVTFKEYSLQDGNTLEATQSMIESRFVDTFPLNDQEVALRHLHNTAQKFVDEYEKGQAIETPDRKNVVKGKSVSVRVDCGGRCISKQKKKELQLTHIKI